MEKQREGCIPVAEVKSIIVLKASCRQGRLQGDMFPGCGYSVFLLGVVLNRLSIISCMLEKDLQEESLKGARPDSPFVAHQSHGQYMICLLLQMLNRSSWIGNNVMMNLLRQVCSTCCSDMNRINPVQTQVANAILDRE